MTIANSVETPATIASQSRQLPTVKISGFHGSLNVTIAPTIEDAIPTMPHAKSTRVFETRTFSNFSGYARLTRKMSAKRSTIDRHQITVTAAWKVRYAWPGKFELCAQGPKVTIAKIDARTVWR